MRRVTRDTRATNHKYQSNSWATLRDNGNITYLETRFRIIYNWIAVPDFWGLRFISECWTKELKNSLETFYLATSNDVMEIPARIKHTSYSYKQNSESNKEDINFSFLGKDKKHCLLKIGEIWESFNQLRKD